MASLVSQLGEKQVSVESQLRTHAELTQHLATTTQSLREALANPKARGQWGERMAEDILRHAGFIEHVNYEKQVAVEGGRTIPDFTFFLPKGQVLYMDVKFPLAVLPPLPRSRHRRRAGGPQGGLPARRAPAGEGAGRAPLRRHRVVGRRGAALPPQRVGQRLRPRARPGPARRRPAPQGGALLAPQPLRAARCHPAGPRRHGRRAHRRRHARHARCLPPPVGQVHRGARQRREAARVGPQGLRGPQRHPSPPAREAARPAGGAAPPAERGRGPRHAPASRRPDALDVPPDVAVVRLRGLA